MVVDGPKFRRATPKTMIVARCNMFVYTFFEDIYNSTYYSSNIVYGIKSTYGSMKKGLLGLKNGLCITQLRTYLQ